MEAAVTLDFKKCITTLRIHGFSSKFVCFFHHGFLWVELSMFVRHSSVLESFKNFEKLKTLIHRHRKLRQPKWRTDVKEVNHGAKILTKLQILMYKTIVFTPVNGRIIHQEQQISEKSWHYSTYIDIVMSYCAISLFYLIFAVFDA